MEDTIEMDKLTLRYILALMKIRSALYKIGERNVQAINEDLLSALNDVTRYREHIEHIGHISYGEELQKIQTYLKRVEDSLIKSIEIEDLEKKREKIEETERMQKDSLKKVFEVFYESNNGDSQFDNNDEHRLEVHYEKIKLNQSFASAC